MILKVLGIIDILSAMILLFNAYNIHWVITNIHIIIMTFKGLFGMLGGPVGIVMGTTDILTAVFIMFAITGLLPIKIILIIILLYKGVASLV
ncbi:hypothetical protein HYZ41_04335 [archaeon]|nr:hypothetical protein [archaeon]